MSAGADGHEGQTHRRGSESVSDSLPNASKWETREKEGSINPRNRSNACPYTNGLLASFPGLPYYAYLYIMLRDNIRIFRMPVEGAETVALHVVLLSVGLYC